MQITNEKILQAHGFENINGAYTRKTDGEVIEIRENVKDWIIERTFSVATYKGSLKKTIGNSYSKEKYTLVALLHEFLNEPTLNEPTVFNLTHQELEDILIERIGWALRDSAEYYRSPYPTLETIKHYTRDLEKFRK